MRYAFQEQFHIAPKKIKIIMDFLVILRRTIEELGGKWLGCYLTCFGEGESSAYEMLFEFDKLEWLEVLEDKLDTIPESGNWDEFTYQRSNKILKRRY